jgi:hypothetical protein
MMDRWTDGWMNVQWDRWMGVLDLPVDAYLVAGKEVISRRQEMLSLKALIHPFLRCTS